MNIILTAVLATVAGLTWNWTTGNAPMSYWLMGGFFIASSAGADLLELAWQWHRGRRRTIRRSHARPKPTIARTES